MVAGSAILLALALGPVGAAVQTWTGSSPPSGSCVGERVVATTANPSATYCCVSSTWTNCTAAGGGGGAPTTAHVDIIEGVIIPSANGTMQIRGAGSAAQTSTVYQGSSCFVF